MRFRQVTLNLERFTIVFGPSRFRDGTWTQSNKDAIDDVLHDLSVPNLFPVGSVIQQYISNTLTRELRSKSGECYLYRTHILTVCVVG